MEIDMNRSERRALHQATQRAAEEARQRASETSPPTGEASVPPDSLEAVAIRVANKLEVAKAAFDASADAPRMISEAKAREMLASAAELVDKVVHMTRAALAEVPLPRLREAYEIVNAKPAENNAGKLPAQKRPRRGFDPVVSLVKTGLQAASLVNRLVAKLHPHLGKKAA
jgi:hypothetical protein